jgi:hypothetical protein
VRDKAAPDAADSLRELFGNWPVRFITASDADPEAGKVFQDLIAKEVARIDAAAEQVRLILADYETAGKPFGLFLRTFEREAYQYAKIATDSDPETRTVVTTNGPGTLESRLHEALQQRLPFIAVRNQSAWLSRGLIPRFTVKDVEWEATAEDLATKAALIVVDCFALAPGLSSELEILQRRGRQDSTVIVLNEQEPEVEPDVNALRGLVRSSRERPGKEHPAVADFARVAYESEIAWKQLETSPQFADLLAAASRQAMGDLAALAPAHRVRLMIQRVRDLRTQHELEAAAALAAETIMVARHVGDRSYLANAFLSAGIVASEGHELAEALSHFHEAGLLFHRIGDKNGEAAAAMWTGVTYKKGGNADKAVMMLLIALQSSVETEAENDIIATLREMAPLLSEVSRKTRDHPGVRRAGELIEQLGLDPTKAP